MAIEGDKRPMERRFWFVSVAGTALSIWGYSVPSLAQELNCPEFWIPPGSQQPQCLDIFRPEPSVPAAPTPASPTPAAEENPDGSPGDAAAGAPEAAETPENPAASETLPEPPTPPAAVSPETPDAAGESAPAAEAATEVPAPEALEETAGEPEGSVPVPQQTTPKVLRELK